MKDFNYIIIGGGCAGLSLAYELEIHEKLKNKTLAIIEPRDEYKRDKTWSFWKTFNHNYDDCVKKNWKNFSINVAQKTKYLECDNYPYQSIDSGLFYKKINNKLRANKNIHFYKNDQNINFNNSLVFNSLPNLNNQNNGLWQHFCGVEIETKKEIFDEEMMNLMDFDCEQRGSVHFFYTLPYTKKTALVETTWLSEMKDKTQKDYDKQIKEYVEINLKIKDYKITYREEGSIPLFYPIIQQIKNRIDIGTAGGMTRLSTGYTFINIQEQSKFIRENIDSIDKMKSFQIKRKYQFLDKIFLKVLKKNPNKMPNIFFKMFNSKSSTVIKFLSNRSNFFEDLSIILKMPKWLFIKALF